MLAKIRSTTSGLLESNKINEQYIGTEKPKANRKLTAQSKPVSAVADDFDASKVRQIIITCFYTALQLLLQFFTKYT